MTGAELAGWLVLLGPPAIALAGLVSAAILRAHPPSREMALGGADYVDAVKAAVEFAESYGAGVAFEVTGAAKLAAAVRQMDAWLEAQGIHGDPKKVTLERVRADIELMRVRLFPTKPKGGAPTP